jgi:hypothetical protein
MAGGDHNETSQRVQRYKKCAREHLGFRVIVDRDIIAQGVNEAGATYAAATNSSMALKYSAIPSMSRVLWSPLGITSMRLACAPEFS